MVACACRAPGWWVSSGDGSTSDGTDPGCPWGRGLPKLVGEEEASVAVWSGLESVGGEG